MTCRAEYRQHRDDKICQLLSRHRRVQECISYTRADQCHMSRLPLYHVYSVTQQGLDAEVWYILGKKYLVHCSYTFCVLLFSLTIKRPNNTRVNVLRYVLRIAYEMRMRYWCRRKTPNTFYVPINDDHVIGTYERITSYCYWLRCIVVQNKSDIMQMSQPRWMLKIKLVDKIRHSKIYECTQTTPWSEPTNSRRLSWFGPLLRLPEETPARQALN
jgi:hypothetical protein